MKGYNYDDKSIYTGSVDLRLDPLEPDRYLVPRNCTTIEVPEYGENQIPVFIDGKWEVQEDYRGKTIYNTETKESETVKEVGPIPDGWTLEEPCDLCKWDTDSNSWVLDIDQVKNKLHSDLKNQFNKKYINSVIHSVTIDKDIDAGTTALNNINGLLDILANDDDTVDFRLADNSFMTVTRAQLADMKTEIIEAGQTLYKNKWAIEAAIDAETDAEKLNTATIDLDNGQLVYPTTDDSTTTS